MWKRLSIGKKLFIAMMITVIVVIGFVALQLTISMRDGFENYILQAEILRFDPVINELLDRHDPNNPTWPELKDNRRALNKLLRDALPDNTIAQGRPPDPKLIRERRNQPPPRQGSKVQRRAAPPPDPLQINARFGLLGPDGEFLAGGDFKSSEVTRKAIVQKGADGKEKVLGYIVLAKPARNFGSPSNLFVVDQIRSLALTLLVALILSAIAAFWLSRQFTRPVNRLVSGTQRLALGEYDLRLEKTSEDEFGNLVDQFNLLAEQLAKQEKSERQWMSDTSHELQTPLAVLRAEIEAMQDGVRKADEKTLETLHLSVTRLSALVKDISQLSHAREGRLVQNWTKADFSALAQDASTKAIGQIEEKGLTLETDLAGGVIAECDAMRVSQLIDNIVTNAMRYTNAPGTIKLSVRKEGEEAIVRVDDSNSPPTEDAMAKIFDRFYRADQSRTRSSNKVGGSGLGLSICKLIAHSHQGDLTAEPSPMGGLAMIFRMPLTRKSDAK